MISIEQISGEIAALEDEKPTHVTMQKLAALYTVRDHMVIQAKPENEVAVVYQSIPDIGTGTEFAELIQGKDSKEAVTLMDELMTALQVVQPRLYDSVIRKLSE